METTFKILYKYRNKRAINKCNEVKFFNRYKDILKDNDSFMSYAEPFQVFDIIRGNIIIRSLLNKNTLDKIIDDEYSNKKFNLNEEINEIIREKSLELPFIRSKGFKIFIPFFNISTNLVYSKEYEKFYLEPYKDLKKKFAPFIINPFETYQLDVFDSLFTNLVKVSSDRSSVAFYHYDLKIIFIINDQGYLDSTITLFDKYLKNPNFEHIIERVKPIINAYYDADLKTFVYQLYENKLISYKVFRKLCKEKKI